jgi:ferredoxin-type protein NapF
MSELQRRKLFSSFRKHFSAQEAVILRPPYCADFALFDSECLTCKEKSCASLCQEEIILIDNEGKPFLSFKQSGCTYCDACAKACESGVLNLTCKAKINAKVTINTQNCLAWQEVICSSCLDVCKTKAIEFFGLFRPKIDEKKCTSCGLCFSLCPTRAIDIKGV